MSIFSRIRDFFTGGSKKSKTTTRRLSRANTVSYYGGGGASGGYRAYSEARRKELQRKRERQEQENTTKKLAAITDKVSGDVVNTAKNPKVLKAIEKRAKSTPPKPKAKVSDSPYATKSGGNSEFYSRNTKPKTVTPIKDPYKGKVTAVNAKADDPDKDRLYSDRRDTYGVNAKKYGYGTSTDKATEFSDGEFVRLKRRIEEHPKIESFGTGVASGGTFGVSDVASMALGAKNKQVKELNETYEKNKKTGYEIAGMITGSIPSFGGIANPARNLLGRGVTKVAPRLAENATEKMVERYAGKWLVRRAAEKATARAVERGLVEGATKEVTDAFAKNIARRIVTGVQKDIAINMTGGALMDATYAAKEAEDTKDFLKKFGQNELISYTLGGIMTVAPELRVGRGAFGIKGGIRSDLADAVTTLGKGKIGKSADDVIKAAVASDTDEAVEAVAKAEPPKPIGKSTVADVAAEGEAKTIAKQTDKAVAEQETDALVDSIVREDTANSVPRTPDVSRPTPPAPREAQALEGLANQNNLTPRYNELMDERRAITDNITAKYSRLDPDLTKMTEPERALYDSQMARIAQIDDELTEVRAGLRELNEARMPRPEEAVGEAEAKDSLATYKKNREAEKAAEPKIEPPETKGATNKSELPYAAVDDDIPATNLEELRLNDARQAAREKLDDLAKETNATNNKFLDNMHQAYKENGVEFPEGEFKQASAKQGAKVRAEDFRTAEQHTKRGYSTIATGIGDEGFQGAAYKTIHEGGVTIDVWHDKTSYADAARRIMKQADEEGGVQILTKRFEDYAKGNLKLNTKEQREMLFDSLAAIDFANANKGQKWAEKLFLNACDAAGEQASVGGLTLRQFHKIAMSSPTHRAEVVKRQITAMFNRNKGFIKQFGGKIGEHNTMGFKTIDDFINHTPELKEAMETLTKMGEATSVDQVEKAASKALLEARKVMPQTALDVITQWRYVAMLSSPKTHIRNAVGNIYSATLGQFKTAVASSLEDAVFKNNKELAKQIKAGKINKDELFKSASGLNLAANNDSRKGIITGLQRDSAKAELEAAEDALAKIKPEDKQAFEKATKIVEHYKSEVERLEKELIEKKPTRITAAKAQEAWHGSSKEKLVIDAQKYETLYNNQGSKVVNQASEFIGKALETSDAISVERIYREAYDKCLMANGYEELAKAAEAGGKGAKAAKARMKKIEEFAEQISAYKAAQDTYRNYNAVANWMNRYVKDTLYNYDAPIYKKFGGFMLHSMMPFTKVPTNIVKRGLDYSPAGLIEGKRMLNKAIESGDVVAINKACERLSEGLVGTGIMSLGFGIGMLDPDGMRFTTRLNKQDVLDKRKKDAGYQDYSFTAFKHNFTLDWATPTAATMFTGIEFGQNFRQICDAFAGKNGAEFTFSDAVNSFMEIPSSLIEPTLQLTMFQGINSALEDVIESDNYSAANIHPALTIINKVFGNYVQSMIPALFGGMSRAFAPYDYFVTGDNGLTYFINSNLAKIPFASNLMFGAKTNSWGEIKNERKTAGDKALSVTNNLLSPSRISKVTWDETDDMTVDFYKKTGWDGVFPTNSYDKDIPVGRIKGEHDLKMTNKELAEYNAQRGRSGEDAMGDALESVIFNRWYKDDKGKYTIEDKNNLSAEEKERIIAQYKGKGIREVVNYIMKTPQFKNATLAEQKQILGDIYGTGGGFGGDDENEATGAKRSAERYIAKKKGMSAEEYDYYNETPRRIQEALAGAIASGAITYDEALDFTRHGGKTYYRTDDRGEKGGTVTTRYNKREMLEYFDEKGLSEDKREILYNAYKSTGKDYNSASTRRGGRRGYRRGGWHRRGGGGSSKVGVNKTAPKVTGLKAGVALTPKSSATSKRATSAQYTPKLARVQAKIDLPTPKASKERRG